MKIKAIFLLALLCAVAQGAWADDVDLSSITSDYTVKDGTTLKGTLTKNVKISIANNATVTLNNVYILKTGSNSYAGLTLQGSATIKLKGTNHVSSSNAEKPGIYVPSGYTLTIEGSGSLVARPSSTSSDSFGGAGIGGANGQNCGKITIKGGTITATGGKNAAGIGSSYMKTCDVITIKGGTVTATAGSSAVAIGAGLSGTCKGINIETGITKITMSATSTQVCAGATSGSHLSYLKVAGVSVGSIKGSSSTLQPYTVKFNANGGTGTMSDQKMISNTSSTTISIPLNANSFTYEGLSFASWNTQADGSGTSYSDQESVSNLSTNGTVTLYAQWTTDTSVFTGDGTEDSPFLIQNASDFTTLANHISNGTTHSGKYFKLTDDIDVTTTIGSYTSDSNYKAFGGHFDGDGHTIGVTLSSSLAPFSCIANATIKDLKVTGTVSSTADYAGGLVGYAVSGTNTIENCRVSTSVSANKLGGGIVGNAQSSTVNLTGCLFKGTVTNTDAENSTAGGLVGYGADATLSYTASVFDGTYDGNAKFLIDDNRQPYAITGDTDVTVENASTATDYSISGITGYGTGIKYSGTYYATIGDIVSINISCDNTEHIIRGYAASGGATLSGDSNPYTLTMADANATITAVYSDGGDSYLIYTNTQWEIFANSVNTNGISYSGKKIILQNDITVSTMVGQGDNRFQGNFDGQGNTITVSYTGITEDYCAPFRCISGATIKNLNTTGTIETSGRYAAGVVAYTRYYSTIENCHSSVTIRSSHAGWAGHGGILGLKANVSYSDPTIEGCVFDGKILTTGEAATTGGAGIVGYTNGQTLTIKNCLYKPAGLETGETAVACSTIYENASSSGSHPVTTVTCENCYYTATLGTAEDGQGKMAHSVTGGEGVTVDFDGDVTEYDVSGISAYTTGMKYGGVIYAAKDETISLNLSYDRPEQCFFNNYETSTGTISGSENPYSLTLADADAVITANTTAVTWEGSGTEDDPYLITTTDELNELSALVSQGTTFADKYLQLSQDIAYSTDGLGDYESNYITIGSPSAPFGGYFDGNGKVISGIRIYKSGDTDSDSYQGVFGYINEQASVSRLTLALSNITGYSYCAGIVGKNDGIIDNCNVTFGVAVSASQAGSTYFGGISGCNNGTLAHNLAISARVPLTSSNYGIIAGGGSGSFWGNYYTNCIVGSTPNTTGRGVNAADITEDDGAVPALRDAQENATSITLMADMPETIPTYGVTLNGRTLYKDGDWNTICLPFSTTITGQLLGATIMELDTEGEYDGHQTGFDAKTGTLYLYFKNATEIEAGKPYIIKWASGSNIVDPAFVDIRVTSTDSEVITSADGKVTFKGIYDPEELPGNDASNLYLGAENNLYWPSEVYTLNAFRAYFHVNLSGEQQVREIRLNLDGEITDVQSVSGKRLAVSETGVWYDLFGRKLNGKPTVPGIYMNNGKKIAITK